MFNCQFIPLSFLCCLYFMVLPKESYAVFWCSKVVLHTLIKCLLDTNIKPTIPFTYDKVEEFIRRFECAQDADCTPKPWHILKPKIRLLRTYVGCMEQWETNIATKILREYYCRKKLANYLPNDLEMYYVQLLPPEAPK